MNDSVTMKLILKYLSGSISQEEKNELTAWLESDIKNKKALTLYERVWSTQEKEGENVNMQTAWNNVAKKAGIALPFEETTINTLPVQIPKSQTITRYGYQFLRYAAVFLVAVSLLFLFKKTTQTTQAPEQQQILVQYGKQNSVVLPDGSKVILDAGSKLSFPKGFDGNVREVFLSGEAYFEVTHNPKKPFVIYANKGIVTVLGTKFNVRAWQFDNEEVKVVVAEGTVSLRANTTNKEAGAIINKGKMSYLTDAHLTASVPTEVNVNTYLAWMKRDLILQNTPLNEVLDRLSRWYNLQFKLPSPVYNRVRITGTFHKKSVAHILEAIGLMTHLNYTRENNTIKFYQSK